jgi:hypothetical protein
MPAPQTHSTIAKPRLSPERSALLDDHLDEPLPPPIKRGRGRAVLLLGAGAVMAAVGIAVVLNIDRGLEQDQREMTAESMEEAPPPPLLGAGETGAPIDEMSTDAIVTRRGWIQDLDKNGLVAQEYRYARSEPSPDGRLHMTRPEVKIYLKDNRVLMMRSESAIVHAPKKALESGRMTGDVLIRMFEMPADRELDEAVDVPVLEVRTQEASYDNFQGDIHAPGAVDIQTATAWLPGTGLRLQINDLEGRPGQLTIDRIDGELRLTESVQQQRDQGNVMETAPVASGDPGSDADRAATQPAPDRVASNAPVKARLNADADERDSAAASAARAQRQRERQRERREGRLPAPQPIEKREGPFFYRLTLNQQVRIRQGDGTRGWTATGDQLHIVFSLDSGDLNQTMSMRSEEPALYGPIEPMPLRAALASLAIASVQHQPSSSPAAGTSLSAGLFKPAESDTIITCTGPLTMMPLANAAEHPSSAEDSRFELLGSPVVLHNNDDATHITCAALQYASLSEVMELIGSADNALTIDSPELYAVGERFWVDRLNHAGAFEGPGWMAAGEAEESVAGAATQPALPPERRGDVRIAWKDGVDLEFHRTVTHASEREAAREPSVSGEADADGTSNPHDSFGRLRLATFNGEVAVHSPDFTLDAQVMSVGFPQREADVEHGVRVSPAHPDAAQQGLASIEFMHAQQNVVAGSMSDGGSIACDDLRVDFASRDGKTVPLKMLAMGGVAASDPDRQTVWSDQLEVMFKPASDVAPQDSKREEASQDVSPIAETRRRAEVDTLTATGSVQILMTDGARAFADRLEADGEGDRVILSGEDVLVASDRTIISKGQRLELTAQGDRVLWPGSGEFAYYASAVVTVDERGRVSRPSVDETANPRQMLARWSESMLYDATFDGGAGSIVIKGDVNAESTPGPLEFNTMTGQEVTLLFAKDIESAADTSVPAPPDANTAPPASAPAEAPASQADDDSMFALDQRGRKLRQIIAKGDARLESRAWLNADHSDKARVFFLAGQHVVYDDQTLEAHVPGGGELLVRDERIDPAATQAEALTSVPGAKRKADMPFGGKGTTHFRWTESLRMNRTQPEGTLYDIVMVGGIEVRHRALDQSISTMTGERLEATVDRSQGQTEQRDAGFDLGGSMDLRRVRALGNVYVDSPTRDVDCDEFDYDYTSGVAKLLAGEGRVVTVMTAGNPNPVQARLFIWNTIDDTVRAQGISGSSAR